MLSRIGQVSYDFFQRGRSLSDKIPDFLLDLSECLFQGCRFGFLEANVAGSARMRFLSEVVQQDLCTADMFAVGIGEHTVDPVFHTGLAHLVNLFGYRNLGDIYPPLGIVYHRNSFSGDVVQDSPF